MESSMKLELRPELVAINKGLGLYYIFVGVYALATGLWGSFTWPLSGGYNIVLIDPWAIFGVALLIIGVTLWSGINPRHIAIPLAPLGIPIIV